MVSVCLSVCNKTNAHFKAHNPTVNPATQISICKATKDTWCFVPKDATRAFKAMPQQCVLLASEHALSML